MAMPMPPSYFGFVLKPGMVAVDIGANIGTYTAFMLSCVRGGGTVFAFEPGEEAFLRGCKKYPAARWYQIAITGQEGPAVLFHGAKSEHHSLYLPNVVSPNGLSENVAAETLDSLQRWGILPLHVDFVKIDTQGAEGAILTGATTLLAAHRTDWLIELWPQGLKAAGTTYLAVIDQLKGAGLAPWEITAKKLVPSTWAHVCKILEHHSGSGHLDVLVRPT